MFHNYEHNERKKSIAEERKNSHEKTRFIWKGELGYVLAAEVSRAKDNLKRVFTRFKKSKGD